MLQLTFCHDQSWRLREDLGDWTLTQEEYTSDWEWFFSPAQHLLWKVDSSGLHYAFRPSRTTRRGRQFLYFELTPTLPQPTVPPPDDYVRATVGLVDDSSWEMENVSSTRESIITPMIPTDSISRFMHFFDKAKESKFVGQVLNSSASISKLIADLNSGTAVAVSDGSYYPDHKMGAARWLILSEDDTEFISGGGMCPGSANEVNAYRCELWGLLGIAAATWALEQAFPHINSPGFTVGCDGEAALKTSMLAYPPSLSTRIKHFDIISGIMGYWRNIRSTPVPTWVEGHLGDHVAFHLLPRLNRLNEEMDEAAKKIASDGIRRNHRYFNIKYEFGLHSIVHKGAHILSEAEKSITKNISVEPLKQYWLNKCDIAATSRSDINWTSFEKATARLPLHRQHFLINWISRMTLVGSVTRKRKIGHQHRCPRCNDWNETYSHVITCYNHKARHIINSLLESLKQWMENENTAPEVVSTLMSILTEWMRKPSSFRPLRLFL